MIIIIMIIINIIGRPSENLYIMDSHLPSLMQDCGIAGLGSLFLCFLCHNSWVSKLLNKLHIIGVKSLIKGSVTEQTERPALRQKGNFNNQMRGHYFN